MIITKLIGGLGNQMFQYSIARALSLKKNTPFRLDVSGFDNYHLHQGFELSRIFDISAEVASKLEIQGIKVYT